VAVRERNKSLGIGCRGEPGLNTDAHAIQQFDDGWRIRLGEIDRGVVGQLPPR
jgi:hypothetical protein